MLRTRRTTDRNSRLITSVVSLFAVAALAMSSGGTAAAAPPGAAPSAASAAAAASAVGSLGISGTSWATGPSGTLHVLADSTVTGAELARLRAVAREFAGALTLERVAGRLRALLSGGDAVHSAGGRCSVGVNVRSGTTYYFVTAGHCTQGLPSWFTSAGLTTAVGPTTANSYPGNDFGVVRYTNPAVPHPGTIGSVDVSGTATAYVGQSVCRRGATTGVRCGVVTALNVTVHYGSGDIVYGLIRTNVCAEPGDSGGPLYAGDKVIGILSGGSGNCTSGGTTYYQPIQEVLSAYGLTVY